MAEVPHVALLIETSRTYGRALVAGRAALCLGERAMVAFYGVTVVGIEGAGVAERLAR